MFMKRVALILIFAFISVNLVSSVFAFDWNPINLVKEAFGKKVSENKDVKSDAKITGHAVKEKKVKKPKCGNGSCETAKGEMKRDVTHELSDKEIKSKEYNTSPFCVKDCGYSVRGV